MMKGPGQYSSESERDKRLAEALRDNLRKRKEQTRKRAAANGPDASVLPCGGTKKARDPKPNR